MNIDDDNVIARAPVSVGATMSIEEALPARIKLTRNGENLILEWRWWGVAALVLVGFALMWNVIAGALFMTGDIPLFFVLTHGGVGILVAYAALAFVFNKTHVEVSFGRLWVHHGPIPFRRGIDVPTNELTQFHVVSRTSRSNNSTQIHWDVVVDRKNGPRLMVVSDARSSECAYAIEQVLEHHLGIVDRPDEETDVDGFDFRA